MNVLEVADAVPCAAHLTKTIIQHVQLPGVIGCLYKLAQVLAGHAGVVVDQAHHVLSELDHVAPSRFKFTERYDVRLVTRYKNFLHRPSQTDFDLVEAEVAWRFNGRSLLRDKLRISVTSVLLRSLNDKIGA